MFVEIACQKTINDIITYKLFFCNLIERKNYLYSDYMSLLCFSLDNYFAANMHKDIDTHFYFH